MHRVEPAWCQYDTEMVAPTTNRINEYLVYDKTQGTITLLPITGTLVPSGASSLQYQVIIRITTTDFDGNTVTKEVTQTVTIRNPCIDINYVSIELPETLENLEYVIDSGAVTYAPIAVGDATQFVKTRPIVHDLCGELRFSILYNNKPND